MINQPSQDSSDLSKSQTLKQLRRTSTQRKLLPGKDPAKVYWDEHTGSGTIEFSDHTTSIGTCLRCPDSPCIQYQPDELVVPFLPSFPLDATPRVCPTDAIHWPLEQAAPSIDSENCIGCGICIARCPSAAISFIDNNAVVCDDESPEFVTASEEEEDEFTSSRNKLLQSPRSGSISPTGSGQLGKFRSKVDKAIGDLDSQFPNLLCRNLFLSLGVSAAIRRRGDTNIRLDMILGPPGIDAATAEIEVGYGGILDAPRNLMDNVAVLCNRYGIEKSAVLPVVVASELPNQRSEYWQLVSDISTVLQMEVATITWGSLALMSWNRVRLTNETLRTFYADETTYSIRTGLEGAIGRSVLGDEGYPGLIESQK